MTEKREGRGAGDAEREHLLTALDQYRKLISEGESSDARYAAYCQYLSVADALGDVVVVYPRERGMGPVSFEKFVAWEAGKQERVQQTERRYAELLRKDAEDRHNSAEKAVRQLGTLESPPTETDPTRAYRKGPDGELVEVPLKKTLPKSPQKATTKPWWRFW